MSTCHPVKSLWKQPLVPFFRFLHKQQTPHSWGKSDPSTELKVLARSFCCPGDREASLRDLFHPLVLLQLLSVQLLINVHGERLMETQLNAHSQMGWAEARMPNCLKVQVPQLCVYASSKFSKFCCKFRNLDTCFCSWLCQINATKSFFPLVEPHALQGKVKACKQTC